MTRSDYRALLWGVGLASAGLLMVELLGVRLLAATLGRDFALFCGLVYPVAAGFGAVLLAGRQASLSSHELCAKAAHRAAIAGAFAAAGGIGITWSSQKVAFANGEAETLHVVVALSSFLLPAFWSGATLGLVVRRAVRVAGRVGFAEGLGMVVGCALLPAAMWLGAPRAVLATGFLFTGAAFLFAHAGRAASPRWTIMWTLPLACTSLIAGDVGAPWMNIRTDNGRRSKIDRYVWTTQGALGLRKASRGRGGMHIDRHRSVQFADGRKIGHKPPFDPADLGYLVDPALDKGPVLVIGSAGGREVDVALAHGHPRVDVVEHLHRLVELHYDDDFARLTGNVLGREKVTVYVNDGRRFDDAIGRDYQHIILLESGRVEAAAPRFLTHHERAVTVEALRNYLSRLRGDGSLLVRVERDAEYATIAAASQALGSAMEGQVIACAGQTRTVILVSPRPYPTPKLEQLTKRCRRSRLTQLLPPPAPRKSVKGAAEDEQRAAERAQKLAAAVAPRDDMPFSAPPPPASGLLGAVLDSVADLVHPPEAEEDAPAPKPKTEETEPAPKATAVGVAGAGGLVAVAFALLALLIPPPRSRDDGKAIPSPFPLRYCFPFLGIATGLCLFSLSDRLLRVCGDGAYAWTLIVPSSLVGLASGRLWVDALKRSRSRRSVMIALAIGLIWLLLLHVVAGQLAGLAQRPLMLRLLLAGTLLVISGFLLGFPAAAGLRYLGQWDRVPVSWAWGQHQLGWGLGLALAAVLVHYVGVARLWPLGVATFAVGAVLLTMGARRAPSSRWYLRRLRASRSEIKKGDAESARAGAAASVS